MVFYYRVIEKVEDILRPLSWKIPISSTIDENCLSIEVRRDFIIHDALREGRKRKFDPWKNLKVLTVVSNLKSDVILLLVFRCSFFHEICSSCVGELRW